MFRQMVRLSKWRVASMAVTQAVRGWVGSMNRATLFWTASNELMSVMTLVPNGRSIFKFNTNECCVVFKKEKFCLGRTPWDIIVWLYEKGFMTKSCTLEWTLPVQSATCVGSETLAVPCKFSIIRLTTSHVAWPKQIVEDKCARFSHLAECLPFFFFYSL